ncbi:MAG: response regulator [Zoogloeaceae bacterium]|jgi:signal transduction histidine kinase/ActR/RegA family two-component response regulator|nr:response regulator [Zoogloeaceae bacterium]
MKQNSVRYAFDLKHEQIFDRSRRNFAVVLVVGYALFMTVSQMELWQLVSGLIAVALLRTTGVCFPVNIQSWLNPLLIVLIYAFMVVDSRDYTAYEWVPVGAAFINFTYLNRKSFWIFLSLSNLVIVVTLGMIVQHLSESGYIQYFLSFNVFCLLLYGALIVIQKRLALLDKNSQTFETIMATTPSYTLISDDKAASRYISASLADWLGISRRLYKQPRPLLDLFPDGDLKKVFQEIMEQSGFVEREFSANVQGKKRWFALRSSPMSETGVARYFEWMDVSPIVEAKEEAEQATVTKSQFLASVSHEIRTPMNAIIGMTELMLANPLESSQIARAMTVRNSALSLLGIINDILDFSKIEAQKMEINFHSFDFSSFIYDAITMVGMRTGSSKVVLTVIITPDIPGTLIGDDIRIRQTLTNILNNAIKYTREGSITLRIWSEAVDSAQEVAAPFVFEDNREFRALKLCFSVRDTGIGIREEDIGKLFGDFQRLDAKKNRNVMGTGLGLAITRRLVEMMGGEISVQSVYGEGSTFSWDILCGYREQDHEFSPIARIEHPEKITRILCYEPVACNAEALGEMLTSLGVCHTIMRDDEEAMRAFAECDYSHAMMDLSLIKRAAGVIPENVKTIVLRWSGERDGGSIGETLERPLIITTLTDLLNERLKYNQDRYTIIRDQSMKGKAFKTRNVQALVVDDNHINLAVATGLLEQYGIQVEQADGGRTGIEMAKAKEYDIIFMDHMMPDIDGLEATQAIRALGGRHEHSVIVALTANAVTEARAGFIEAGMNDFLSKPIIISHLQEVLLKYLPPEKIMQDGE